MSAESPSRKQNIGKVIQATYACQKSCMEMYAYAQQKHPSDVILKGYEGEISRLTETINESGNPVGAAAFTMMLGEISNRKPNAQYVARSIDFLEGAASGKFNTRYLSAAKKLTETISNRIRSGDQNARKRLRVIKERLNVKLGRKQ